MWHGKQLLWSLFSMPTLLLSSPTLTRISLSLTNQPVTYEWRPSWYDPHLPQSFRSHYSYYPRASDFCNSLNIPAISHLLAFVHTNSSGWSIILEALDNSYPPLRIWFKYLPLKSCLTWVSPRQSCSSLLWVYIIAHVCLFYWLYNIIFTHVSLNLKK